MSKGARCVVFSATGADEDVLTQVALVARDLVQHNSISVYLSILIVPRHFLKQADPRDRNRRYIQEVTQVVAFEDRVSQCKSVKLPVHGAPQIAC